VTTHLEPISATTLEIQAAAGLEAIALLGNISITGKDRGSFSRPEYADVRDGLGGWLIVASPGLCAEELAGRASRNDVFIDKVSGPIGSGEFMHP